MSAIKKAVDAAGSQVALAEKLGVTQQAVNKWVADGHVPLKRACQIEVIFGIKAVELVDPEIVNLLGHCPTCED